MKEHNKILSEIFHFFFEKYHMAMSTLLDYMCQLVGTGRVK
jgi:hypothetical protein